MSNPIRINDDSKSLVDAVAAEKNVTANEAADFLLGVAASRRRALAAYAEKGRSGEKPASKKKSGKKKAKKPAAAKKAKAKDKTKAKKKKKAEASEEVMVLN